MINGITVKQNEFATVCQIDQFSDELKQEIRKNLSSICHGPDAVQSEAVFSTYRRTLKEFIKRYNTKTEKIKKGMIGELLTHILLFKVHPDLERASPFFNMEEGSVKKGFDLVVFNRKLEQIWITEVKSGNAGEKNANSFNNNLLNIAKNDLNTRLQDNETNLWHNAINGVKIALSKGKIKDQINQILEECYLEAADEEQNGLNKNVILISVIYKATKDPISLDVVRARGLKIIEEKLFKDVLIFSIQKETYQSVAAFLENEASL